MKKKEEKKYLKRRCIINLPSSFVHRYFPFVHLWPFQSLLFYRFLLLQVKHCVQQDPGEQSKTKCVTFRRRWVSEVVRAYPLRWMHFHNNFFRAIKAKKYCEEFSAKVYGLHFRISLLISNVRGYWRPLKKHSLFFVSNTACYIFEACTCLSQR